MTWAFDTDRPIYAQLTERIKMDIISGAYLPGERLPSVRELSAQASVNPNTMQKALAELEQSGLIYTQRTSGRFITEDESMIQATRESQAIEQISAFLTSMKALGYDSQEILILLQKAIGEKEAEQL